MFATFDEATTVTALGPGRYVGEIASGWDSAGRLVAQSRQLALVPRG